VEKKKKRRGGKEEIEIAGRGGRVGGGGVANRPSSGEKGLVVHVFLRQRFSAQKQRHRGLSGGPQAGSTGESKEQDPVP
jgi:hypothetical protein